VRVEVIVREAETGERAELGAWYVLDADRLARVDVESGVERSGFHASVPPGRYVIDVFPTGHAPARSAPFRVWPARPRTIEVDVVRGRSLAGRAVSRSRNPVSGVWVFFAVSAAEAETRLASMRQSDTRYGAHYDWFPSLIVSDVDGRFRLDHVPSGPVVVAAHRPGADATRDIAIPADPGTGPQPEIRLDDLVLDVDD
jgi:hypothetical protein